MKDQNGVVVSDKDELVRPGTTAEKQVVLTHHSKCSTTLVTVTSWFKYPEVENVNCVHTPGNSSGVVDGASLVLIGNEEGGKAGLKPRAKIVTTALVGTEPTIMLTGTAQATPKALDKQV